MKQRVITLGLAGGCIVFMIIAFIVNAGRDDEAPEITVEKGEVTYTEGDSYEALLDGVSAEDDSDGDLSDKVFVDKIVQTGENSAVVYYGVMDSHNNVGTAKKKIAYRTSESDEAGVEEDQTDQADPAGENPASQDIVPQETLQPDGVRPVMALVADTMTIGVGGEFDLIGVVRDIVDDKDDRDTLYQRISAEGAYDVNTPGSYDIRYYVIDTDGNTSDPHVFTLVVQ